jgi:hypothetical protein
MLRWVLASFVAILAYGARERAVDAKRPAAGASVCIARERDLPIDEAGGLAPVPMPRGLYSVRVDARAAIPISPDRGTLVRGLDPARSHVIALFQYDRPVTAIRFRVSSGEPVCFGLSNYSGGLEEGRPLSQCGCPR